jgi:bifunctional non-homologous end joining protein LigD
MALKEYRRKRDFHKTPEPRGERAPNPKGNRLYIIQKHDATHLHYDFRLEHDGVLKSWAVPKGPDPDPAVKRLAMQVEDHPIEYGDFEGIIPEGEYGGGTVMLWDKGTWEPLGDPDKALREGHLKFVLHGEKLRGGWMLVRKGGKNGPADERAWFLFKERDEFAQPGKSITDELPLSVKTGRDLDEIATESDRVWGPQGEATRLVPKTSKKRSTATKSNGRSGKSDRAKTANRTTTIRRTTAKATKAAKAPKENGDDHASLEHLLTYPGVRRAAMPKTQSVELATLVEAAPPGDDWLHEIKFDGYRMLCRLKHGTAHFISRNNQDWTKKFPELARSAGTLSVTEAILDGEVVSLRPDGTSSFQALQNVFRTGKTAELIYYVFDILYLNGYDLRNAPLELRRNILQRVISEAHELIRFSNYIQGSGEEVIDKACQLHLEGIVSKRRESAYQPGRGLDWVKVKCSQRAEFVGGGFTKPSGARVHLGALLLGHYDRAGDLIYAGRVGTGFDAETLASLHQKLEGLVQPRSSFANLRVGSADTRDVSWVKPELVAEIEFSNWTDEGLLRHASFQGLREDKPASKVIHDEPIPLGEVMAMQNGKNKPAAPGIRKRRARASSTARNSGATPAASNNGEFGGVRLTHPDKVLYKDQGITKRELAEYYTKVADWMLPHVMDRPLAIVRCPEGAGTPCFFQKHPRDDSVWKHLGKVNVAQQGEPEFNLAIEDLAGLISLVQMGVLEIHVWGSRAKTLEKPDRLVFDLDPDPAVDWPEVIDTARQVRALLEGLGLASFLKTTGGKGLHIVVPIQPRLEWPEAKAFCRSIADLIVRAAPDRLIATMSKAARKGKIFIDYLRNGRGATSIAPYSTRAKAGATVSVPIAWNELKPGLKSDHFTIENLPARLSRLKNDPWADLPKIKQLITATMIKRLAT